MIGLDSRVRVYTVAQANDVLPTLSKLMARQMDCLKQLESAVERLKKRADSQTSTPDLRVFPGDSGDIVELKHTVRGAIETLRAGEGEIEETGAVVKDLRTGLIDFYGRRNAQTVWLCWRVGEPAVGFWHPLHRGFDARKPFEPVELLRSLN